MKDIETSTKRKLIVFAAIGLVWWGIVAWFSFNMPIFVIETLPDIIPLSVFVFLIFLIGLLFLTTAVTTTVRSVAPRYTWMVVSASALLIVAYNLSPLAPGWRCFGTKLYVRFANAAGQNCDEVCTDNDRKPCGGYSSCWDKNISCSSAGKDQDGRNCNGCCFSCDIVCEEEEPEYNPPTVSATVSCTQPGSNGWCVGVATLDLTASDPQGLALTISGTIAGAPFTCVAGNSCSIALSQGSGAIAFKATAATSGLSSATGSISWARDSSLPTVIPVVPIATGSNGWYITAPVAVSTTGTDAVSGVASLQLQVNGGGWQTTAASLPNGVHTVNFRTVDVAGNVSALASRTVKVDSVPPALTPSFPVANGSNGWVVTGPAFVSSSGTDAGSGLASVSVSVDTGAWVASASLSDGSHSVQFRAFDNAGNTTIVTRTVKVDLTAPTISIKIAGTSGNSGWYISTTNTTLSATDSISGVDRIEYRYNGGIWQTETTVESVDGVNTLEIKAYDLAGNIATSSRTIRIDTIAPRLNAIYPLPDGLNDWIVTAPAVVSAQGMDSGSGLASARVSVDREAWQDSATLPDGVITVDFKSEDIAGNTTTTSRALKIDVTAPNLTFSTSGTPGNSGWYISETQTSILYSDGTSGIDHVEYRQNSSNWQDAGALISVDGVNTIEAKVYDLAGNITNKTITVKVDTQRPSLAFASSGTLGNSDWYVTNTTTSIETSDQDSGVDIVQYNQNNTGWNNGSTITSTDGVNDINIVVYDAAGNMSIDSLQVKVDTVAPDVNPVVPAPNGLHNWFVSVPVEISATGSDATSGLLNTLVSTNGGEWKGSQSLADGVYATNFRSEDVAGNTSSIFMNLKIDETRPTLAISTAGTAGTNGWYTSHTTTMFEADDKTSGVDRVEYSQNDAAWQPGTSLVSKDGINSISVKTFDKAGNMLSNQVQVKVDTGMPSSTFTSPVNGSEDTVARNVLPLAGTSTDTLSGIAAVELSYDGGKTWVLAVVSTDGTWTYHFDTTKVPDGIYTIVVRTVDIAGNTVVGDGNSDSGAHITVNINNTPPHIKLTPEWFIWDSGELVIKTDYFPVREGSVTISDPQNRWPKVEIPFDDKYPSTIKWDRHFANGILAPIGNYHVEVKACNTYDLCSSKRATIKIPWISVILPTVSPVSPTIVPTNPAVENTPEPSETQSPPVVVVEDVQTPISVEHKPVGGALWLVTFIALMWAVASAALSDRRPVAINAITKTIQQKQNI